MTRLNTWIHSAGFTEPIRKMEGVRVKYRLKVDNLTKKLTTQLRLGWIEGELNYLIVSDSHEIRVGLHSDVSQSRAVPQTHRKYSKWIWLYLVMQAFICYIPYHIWSSCEEQIVENLLQNLPKFELDKLKLASRKKCILDFLSNEVECDSYFYQYCLYRLLNVIVIFMNIVIIDCYLDGKFWGYGYHVLGNTVLSTGFHIMDSVFPLSGNCDIKIYGPGGDINVYGAICEIPVNDVYRMVYIVIWYYRII